MVECGPFTCLLRPSLPLHQQQDAKNQNNSSRCLFEITRVQKTFRDHFMYSNPELDETEMVASNKGETLQ